MKAEIELGEDRAVCGAYAISYAYEQDGRMTLAGCRYVSNLSLASDEGYEVMRNQCAEDSGVKPEQIIIQSVSYLGRVLVDTKFGYEIKVVAEPWENQLVFSHTN